MPELRNFLLGNENWSFLLEVLLRCTISFVVVLLALKLTGKKGVRQLTVFELVIILTLGSAAGDMGFYSEVGVLPAVLTIGSIVLLYRLITYLILKWDRLEKLIEGEPVMIIENGRYTEAVMKNENISFDEFFMELRLEGIEHLGQVKYAILEVNGGVSVFKNERDKTVPGLHILPDQLKTTYEDEFPAEGLYSCICCGFTARQLQGPIVECPDCQQQKWGRGSNTN